MVLRLPIEDLEVINRKLPELIEQVAHSQFPMDTPKESKPAPAVEETNDPLAKGEPQASEVVEEALKDPEPTLEAEASNPPAEAESQPAEAAGEALGEPGGDRAEPEPASDIEPADPEAKATDDKRKCTHDIQLGAP